MLASFCKFYRLRPGVFLIWWSDKPFSTACNPDRVGGTFLVVNKPFEKTFDIKKTSNIFFSSLQTRHCFSYAMATEREIEIWSWIKCETRFWLEIGSIAGDKTVKRRPPLEKKVIINFILVCVSFISLFLSRSAFSTFLSLSVFFRALGCFNWKIND